MKILITGSRSKKDYFKLVEDSLNTVIQKGDIIIEGCCQNSADEYAERWAAANNILVEHYPGTPGTFLKRNRDMVKKADKVLAFWDEYSYGTAHTIACAVLNNKPVQIISLK